MRVKEERTGNKRKDEERNDRERRRRGEERSGGGQFQNKPGCLSLNSRRTVEIL